MSIQKTVRKESETSLDSEVNKLLKEGWIITSDVKCVIKQNNLSNSSDNTEIWYQTLRKYD